MALRIGIVGTGGIGNHHAAAFSKMAGVRVVSCCDALRERAEKCQKQHGIEFVAKDFDQLLDQVDAVVISTPDADHAPKTLATLAAGKHVLCEKPLTSTFEEARAVAAAAAVAGKKGIIHMVDFSYRRSAAIQELMRMVKAGHLGQIRQVESSYLQSWLPARTPWNPTEDWRASGLLWKLCKASGSGGVLYDLGCHLLDLTTACSDDIAKVHCALRTYPKPLPDGTMVTSWEGKALDANDTAFIEFEMKSGGIGLAHTSRWATGYSNAIRLQVHGTEGAVRLDLDRSYEALDLCLGEARHRQTWDTRYFPPAPSLQERFAKAAQTGVQDQPDLFRGAQIQAYLHACELSAAAHAWQPIPAWS